MEEEIDDELQEEIKKNAQVCSDMSILMKSRGWKKLLKTLEAMKAEQTEKVMNSRGQDFEERFSVCDLYKENVETYNLMIGLPETIRLNHS